MNLALKRLSSSNYYRVWFCEAISRLLQVLLGGQLFDLPPFLYARNATCRYLFKSGKGLLIGSKCLFIVPHGICGGYLKIGINVKFNRNVEIDYSGGVVIGDDVWISQNVLIETHNHIPSKKPKSQWAIRKTPLRIHNNAWIGANVIILESCESIGAGCIVAAGAVVTKNVTDYSIVGGVPAHRIGEVK